MKVSVQDTLIDAVKVVALERFKDDRGFFMEVFREDTFKDAGLPCHFVQFNHSGSVKNTVRGLHFQWEPPMGKMMRVVRGRAFLVAVDIRPDSATLGKHVCMTLDEEQSNVMIWAPADFARGFAVLSDYAEIQYMTTGTYNGCAESGILWNDPALGIPWPVEKPILSKKDENAQTLAAWLDRAEAKKFSIHW